MRKIKLWSPFSDESSLGEARLHRIPIAGVTAIHKRQFGSTFSKFSWFPEHEKLCAKPRTYKLLVRVCAVQLGCGNMPSFSFDDRSNCARGCPRRKAWSVQSFSAARAVPWLLALDMGGHCKAESLLLVWKLRESLVSHFWPLVRGCTSAIEWISLHVGVVRRDGRLRAYSFCAVFLFRFINRNRNRRVQKEQFSSERNNFHGNKMAYGLISNRKGKKYQNYTRMKFEKYGRLFRQTSRLRRPRYLVRSFSSVVELAFMDTIRKWRAAAVLTSVFFEGKSCEKDVEQEEEEFVVLSMAAVLLRRKRARRKLFHCSRRQGNKGNVDAPA